MENLEKHPQKTAEMKISLSLSLSIHPSIYLSYSNTVVLGALFTPEKP